MEQNTNQQAPEQQQPQNDQKFDPNQVSKTSWIHGGIALVGAIGVFLPWAKVSFFGISTSASGLDAWQGILSLIVLVLLAVVVIAGPAIKMPENSKDQLMKYGIYIPLAFSVWVLIDVLTTKMVQVGIGLWITLLASAALALIANKVIKLK
ncbi:MAG: hypothetical protein C0592_14030 [Marinilabiliales bacterium]|nr:MAG: hypothetical protein C0592_14030 [Marinilabiliales bacterium]